MSPASFSALYQGRRRLQHFLTKELHPSADNSPLAHIARMLVALADVQIEAAQAEAEREDRDLTAWMGVVPGSLEGGGT